jgi:hypothetical protein
MEADPLWRIHCGGFNGGAIHSWFSDPDETRMARHRTLNQTCSWGTESVSRRFCVPLRTRACVCAKRNSTTTRGRPAGPWQGIACGGFRTKIWHPHVCLSTQASSAGASWIAQAFWSPAMTIRTLMVSEAALLPCPVDLDQTSTIVVARI